MPSVVFELTQTAISIAREIRRHNLELKVDIEELEAKIVRFKQVLESQSQIEERLRGFHSLVANGDICCPACWMSNGIKTMLTPVDDPDFDTENDPFECKVCGMEFEFEP